MELEKLFWISTIVLWAFLGITALYLTNKSLLVKRGYDESYARFLKRDNAKRLILIAVFLPAIELIAAFLTIRIFNVQTIENQMIWITFIALSILLPIIIMDHVETKRKIRELAIKNKPEFVIDFKYKIIRLAFQPTWEMVTGILFLIYGLTVIKPFFMSYLHLIIPWLMYLTVRGHNYTTKPMMRDSYLWIFIFLMLNYALIIFYHIRCFVQCYTDLRAFEIYIGYFIGALLVVKFVIYGFNYSVFRKQLINN